MDGDVSKRATATVIEDPAKATGSGAKLTFHSRPFPPDLGKQGTHYINNWDFFEGVVLATNVADTERQRIWGSAVMVAPGVALAASHVLDEELKDLVDGKTTSVFTGVTPEGAILWRPT